MEKSQYFSQFADVLRLEADAIARTAERSDSDQVERAVDLLKSCRGKAVIIGVGKSGNIAQKIAATLTSTGSAAVFLHPSDALHGGLGIVATGDVVIALSNSGETDEIVSMIPYFRNRSVPIIAIVGDIHSTLGRSADVVLDACVDKEACPLNLAPTTSTSVALAIGDALAMTLMGAKGLTEHDFAQNHPAGRLGKRLILKVADLMHSENENPVVEIDASWLEVVSAVSRGGLGAVNVIDGSKKLLGIITDGDLRRVLQRTAYDELQNLKSGSIMTANPVVARPELLAYDALKLMEERPSQISVLPVVDDQHVCIGLLRLHDVVRSGL
jgi:arabinose-5-phosphate isomerase